MRLSRAAACRSIAGCLLALTLGAPFVAAASPATILDVAAQQKDLTTFVAAVKTAGLESALRAAGPMTVFAPTDAAFAKMPAADRDALLADAGKLKSVLLGMVANEAFLMRDGDTFVTSGWVASASGGKLMFGGTDKEQTVGQARIVRSDLRAGNGSLTTIDRVILP
jgi:uncharacterized surface protein with fasciclin (FAS1) repeats